MESDELADRLLTRARRAYELGRLRRAWRVSAVVLPLVALSLLVTRNALASGLTGAALLATTVTFRWRGRALGSA
jgi:hypothetical protein